MDASAKVFTTRWLPVGRQTFEYQSFMTRESITSKRIGQDRLEAGAGQSGEAHVFPVQDDNLTAELPLRRSILQSTLRRKYRSAGDITHSVTAVLRKDFIGFTRLPWEDRAISRLLDDLGPLHQLSRSESPVGRHVVEPLAPGSDLLSFTIHSMLLGRRQRTAGRTLPPHRQNIRSALSRSHRLISPAAWAQTAVRRQPQSRVRLPGSLRDGAAAEKQTWRPDAGA
jgi:hypothetical protein